jgi:CHAT domain-containing protein
MLPLDCQPKSYKKLDCVYRKRSLFHCILSNSPVLVSAIIFLVPLIILAESSSGSERRTLTTQTSEPNSFKKFQCLAQSTSVPEIYLLKTSQALEQAIRNSEEVLKICREVGDRYSEAHIFLKLGNIYSSQNQIQKGLDFYNQALKIYKANSDLRLQATTLSRIAGIYHRSGQIDKALDFYNQSVIADKTFGNHLSAATNLGLMTQIYISVKQPDKAINTYNHEILEYRLAGKSSLHSTVSLKQIARLYIKNGQSKKAIKIYKQASKSERHTGELETADRTLISLAEFHEKSARSHLKIKQFQKAIEEYNNAVNSFKNAGDDYMVINSLYKIARIYADMKQFNNVFATYKRALLMQQTEKDSDGQAQTLEHIGFSYNSVGQHQKALKIYNQALSLLETNTDKNRLDKDLLEKRSKIQASILHGIGETYFLIGDGVKSVSYYILSQKAYLNLEKNPQKLSNKLIEISDDYIRIGNRKEALLSLEMAIKVQRSIKDISGELKSHKAISKIYFDSGEIEKSIDLYNQVINIQIKKGDQIGQIESLQKIANIYELLGDYRFSLDTLERALQLAQKVNAYTLQEIILRDMSNLSMIIGDYPKSNDFLRQMREIPYPQIQTSQIQKGSLFSDFYKMGAVFFDTINHERREFSELHSMLIKYVQIKKYSQAIDVARSILNSKITMTPKMRGTTYAWMGRAYLKLDNYQQAIDSFNQALSLLRSEAHISTEAVVLSDLGDTYTALTQYSKAREVYDLAMAKIKTQGDLQIEVKILYQTAVMERKRGNIRVALTEIESGIKNIEGYRARIPSPELRTSYFALVQEYYDFYIDLLMQLHKQQPSKGFNAGALQVSERARARSLLDLLNESQADIRQGADPKLLQQEKNLQFKLNTLEKQRVELYSKISPTETQKTNFEKNYDLLQFQYRALQTQIRSSNSRYTALTQLKPLTLLDIQKQVIDDNTLLLEYHLGKERSYLWLVSKTGITSYELPKQVEIEVAAQHFQQAIADSSKQPQAIYQASKSLSQMLLGSAVKQLGRKRLLIVSNGALQYLPFAALSNPADTKPLLASHEIINLPSASTLATLRQELNGRKPAAKTAAVFADPVFSRTDQRVSKNGSALAPNNSSQESINSLPFSVQNLRSASQDAGMNFGRIPETRQEAENILKLIPANTQSQAFDFKASRENVLNSNLSQYRIIHFATHGILNTTRPELSAVVLSLVDQKGNSQNGFLRLNDIFNLNLPAELVVLSACQTGLGQNIRGEGLIGLTRGFMYAGTPRVLVSLWSVNDESTAVLMTHFYKAMLEQKWPPAAALRAAQMEMLKHSKWRSPYYWAAFTLQGEWK